MRKWLLATLAAVAMAAGLVAYQPAPHRAEALNDYCILSPNVPVLDALRTIHGFVDWECTKKPAGQEVSVQLQRFWTSDQKWHNQGVAQTFTTPSSNAVYSDITACNYTASTTRRWRTHTWSLVWFTPGGNVSSASFSSNSKTLHCYP